MDLNKAEKYVLGMMLASSNSGPIDNCDIHHLKQNWWMLRRKDYLLPHKASQAFLLKSLELLSLHNRDFDTGVTLDMCMGKVVNTLSTVQELKSPVPIAIALSIYAHGGQSFFGFHIWHMAGEGTERYHLLKAVPVRNSELFIDRMVNLVSSCKDYGFSWLDHFDVKTHSIYEIYHSRCQIGAVQMSMRKRIISARSLKRVLTECNNNNVPPDGITLFVGTYKWIGKQSWLFRYIPRILLAPYLWWTCWNGTYVDELTKESAYIRAMAAFAAKTRRLRQEEKNVGRASCS